MTQQPRLNHSKYNSDIIVDNIITQLQKQNFKHFENIDIKQVLKSFSTIIWYIYKRNYIKDIPLPEINVLYDEKYSFFIYLEVKQVKQEKQEKQVKQEKQEKQQTNQTTRQNSHINVIFQPTSLGVQNYRNIISSIKPEINHLILISPKITPDCKKIIETNEKILIELFTLKETQYNIFKINQMLNLEYVKLVKDDIGYDVENLPKLLTTNIITKVLNLKNGDILEFRQYCPNRSYYRIVTTPFIRSFD